MKILEIRIDGFGKWHEQTFILNHDFQIFYGANEAGKSTLVNFINGILFGFPKKSEHYQQYIPKNGSLYGGSLLIEDENKNKYLVSRHKGKKGGNLNITDDQGNEYSEDKLVNLRLNITRDLYEDIFCFDQKRLSEIISLTPNDLQKNLQQFGAVNSNEWLKLTNQLNKKSESLYKRRGRKPKLNEHLKEYANLQEQLNNNELSYQKYIQLQQNINEEKQQLTDIDNENKLTAQLSKYQRLLKLWPIYQEKDNDKRKLSESLIDQVHQLQIKLDMYNDQLHTKQKLFLNLINEKLNEVHIKNSVNYGYIICAFIILFGLGLIGFSALKFIGVLLLILSIIYCIYQTKKVKSQKQKQIKSHDYLLKLKYQILNDQWDSFNVNLINDSNIKNYVFELQQVKQSQQQIKQKLNDIYQKYEINDSKAFDELVNEQRNQINKIQLTEQDQKELSKFKDINEIQQQVIQLNNQLQSINKLKQSLQTNQGYLKRLTEDVDLSLSQKVTDLKEVISKETSTWIATQLSIKLINKVLHLASADRFPKIIQLAQKYFSILTNNRYPIINLNNNEITVLDDQKNNFNVSELSQGTAEQLNVALKLAFVEVIHNQIDLPIIIDDGFVNFDNQRKNSVLRLLNEISKHNQVIYLTANDNIYEQNESNIINL